MIVRALNEYGTYEFGKYLGELREGSDRPAPVHMLQADATSGALSGLATVDNIPLVDSLEAAEYLVNSLTTLSEGDLQASGVWTWLALFYFDQVCPDRNGLRSPKADERYILSDDRRKRYRHLLEGPYRMVRMHGRRARVMLRHPPYVHSDLSEQLTSRQEIATNRALIEAADLMYYNVEIDRLKRGVTDRDRGGTVRRLVAVSQQLDRTYDIYSLTGEELLSLLPDEFHRWL